MTVQTPLSIPSLSVPSLSIPSRDEITAWLDNYASDSVAIMSAIAEAGFEARLVGGAVRAAILREPPVDFDFATSMPVKELLLLGESRGFRVSDHGVKHGVAFWYRSGKNFELAQLRRDEDTDGRWARVSFEADWQQDAERRDLTLSAIYLDRHGNIFDSVGGIADLLAGRVAFIGSAKLRIAEDYLRILRYFRFWCRFGLHEMDSQALKAIAEQCSHLPQLSRERITGELLQILQSDMAGTARDSPDKLLAVVRVMLECGVLTVLFPGSERRDFRPDYLERLHTLLSSQYADAEVADSSEATNSAKRKLTTSLQRLLALSPWLGETFSGKHAHDVAAHVISSKHLVFSKHQIKLLTASQRLAAERFSDMTKFLQMLYVADSAEIAFALNQHLATGAISLSMEAYHARNSAIKNLPSHPLPFNGADVLKATPEHRVLEGAQFGEVYRRAIIEWIKAGRPQRAQELNVVFVRAFGDS